MGMDQEPTSEKWTWMGVSNRTRAVIAAFTGHVGDQEGWLSPPAFLDAMTEGFGYEEEHVIMGVTFLGWKGERRSLVTRLGGVSSEQTTEVVNEVAQLAGASEGVRALAEQVGRQIANGDKYEAIPGLQVLSEIAVSRLEVLVPSD